MEKKIDCPLCYTNNICCVEKIHTKDIVNLWLKQDVDTQNLFKDANIVEKYLCYNCGLGFFNPFISGDNAFYSKLSENEWYYLHEDKTEFDYSNAYIKEGDSVLDIGSGRGAFTKYIDKSISYTGLELSSKAVKFANSENINVIEQTIEDYAIINKATQDVVVTFQVLEHITNIDSFIKSAISTIKPNGLFIIAVPNNDAFIKNTRNNLLNLPPHHLLHWNEKSLKYIAKKYNLEIIDIYKEKVTNVHKIYYYSVQINKFLYSLCGIKIKSINNGLFHKIIHKIIYKIASLLVRIFKYTNIHKNKDGQTISIVLRKNV